jgi:hypothetical protein
MRQSNAAAPVRRSLGIWQEDQEGKGSLKQSVRMERKKQKGSTTRCTQAAGACGRWFVVHHLMCLTWIDEHERRLHDEERDFR